MGVALIGNPPHQVELHDVLHALSICWLDANGAGICDPELFLTNLDAVRILPPDPGCIGREIASSRGVRADEQGADWREHRRAGRTGRVHRAADAAGRDRGAGRAAGSLGAPPTGVAGPCGVADDVHGLGAVAGWHAVVGVWGRAYAAARLNRGPMCLASLCFLAGLAAGQPRRRAPWRGWAAPGAGRLGVCARSGPALPWGACRSRAVRGAPQGRG